MTRGRKSAASLQVSAEVREVLMEALDFMWAWDDTRDLARTKAARAWLAAQEEQSC